MGVSKNRGTPKWMVKIMENPIKMDDLGVPLFSETCKYGFMKPTPPPPISGEKVSLRRDQSNLTLQVSDFGLDTQLLEARQALQLLHLNGLVIGFI